MIESKKLEISMNDLKLKLEKRKIAGNFRSLKRPSSGLDFCSNDYLGHAQSPELAKLIGADYAKIVPGKNGSTGSRLLTGNSEYVQDLEPFLASLFRSESALLFNSGYMANLGFLSCVPQRTDTIIYDSLSHASIRSGVHLSKAKNFSFQHNDLADLKKKIKRASGQVYVVVESVYSMDGDFSPLEEVLKICENGNCRLLVDEAHSTGLWGENGNGLCCHLGIDSRVFARIHTFGKTIGAEGAAIVGSQILVDYLINFSSPFIYTTAPSVHNLVTIKNSLEYRKNNPSSWAILEQNIAFFAASIKEIISNNLNIEYLSSNSPIQILIVPGNTRAKAMADTINHAGYDVRPILSPTVKEGQERLRICLHTFNSQDDIQGLLKSIKNYLI